MVTEVYLRPPLTLLEVLLQGMEGGLEEFDLTLLAGRPCYMQIEGKDRGRLSGEDRALPIHDHHVHNTSNHTHDSPRGASQRGRAGRGLRAAGLREE